MTDAAILTEGLAKRYGRQQALHGLDLSVSPGEVFGFLGPNGAWPPPISSASSSDLSIRLSSRSSTSLWATPALAQTSAASRVQLPANTARRRRPPALARPAAPSSIP